MGAAPGWHEISLRVRYAETDGQGIVYHSNYLIYWEVARAEFTRSLGVPYQQMEARGVQLVVAEATVRYRSPARYDDELRVRIRVGELRRRTVRFEYEILAAADSRVVVTGHTVHVSIGPDFRPADLPDWVTTLFESSRGPDPSAMAKAPEASAFEADGGQEGGC